MASYRNENRPDSGDLLSWIITIVLLVSPVWPIGLILLLRKLTGGSRRRASRHPYDIQREGGPVPGTQGMPGAQRQTPPVGRQHVGRSPRQGRPVNLDRGKGLTVWGIVLTVIFGIALTGFPAVAMSGGFLSALAVMSPVIGFFGGGLAMIWAGTQRTKKAKRFRKYLALIGRRESISITTLAQAMPVSVHKACDDLQDMLDSGILETGYPCFRLTCCSSCCNSFSSVWAGNFGCFFDSRSSTCCASQKSSICIFSVFNTMASKALLRIVFLVHRSS